MKRIHLVIIISAIVLAVAAFFGIRAVSPLLVHKVETVQPSPVVVPKNEQMSFEAHQVVVQSGKDVQIVNDTDQYRIGSWGEDSYLGLHFHLQKLPKNIVITSAYITFMGGEASTVPVHTSVFAEEDRYVDDYSEESLPSTRKLADRNIPYGISESWGADQMTQSPDISDLLKIVLTDDVRNLNIIIKGEDTKSAYRTMSMQTEPTLYVNYKEK